MSFLIVALIVTLLDLSGHSLTKSLVAFLYNDEEVPQTPEATGFEDYSGASSSEVEDYNRAVSETFKETDGPSKRDLDEALKRIYGDKVDG